MEAQNTNCVSNANIKALEDDLLQRLEFEVEQVSNPKPKNSIFNFSR